MGWSSVLGWTVAGVAAVVAAPVTGGGSLAVLIGAAGTTTLVGAAFGAATGAAVGAAVDAVFGDDDEEKRRAEREAAEERAKRTASEEKRARETKAYEEERAAWHERESKHARDKEKMLERLKGTAARTQDVDLLFMLAAVLVREQGNSDPDVLQQVQAQVSMLCADCEAAESAASRHFSNAPMSATVIEAFCRCTERHTLARLAFVVDIMAGLYGAEAHDWNCEQRSNVCAAFRAHAEAHGLIFDSEF